MYEENGLIKSLEIKEGKTIHTDFTKGLETWVKSSGQLPSSCSIVYAGDKELSLHDIKMNPWNSRF